MKKGTRRAIGRSWNKHLKMKKGRANEERKKKGGEERESVFLKLSRYRNEL